MEHWEGVAMMVVAGKVVEATRVAMARVVAGRVVEAPRVAVARVVVVKVTVVEAVKEGSCKRVHCHCRRKKE